MLSNVIGLGDKIDISLWNEETQGEIESGKSYASMVYEITDEEDLVVTIPTDKDKLVLMPTETVITIVMYAKSGVYTCVGKIAERFKSGTLFLMRVELTSKLTKFQRRAYYRWECRMGVEYRLLPDDVPVNVVNEKNLDYYLSSCLDENLYKGVVKDVSGGGIRFTSEKETREKSILMLSFQLESDTYIFQPIVLGRLLHCDDIAGDGSYEYRVEFQGISEADREIIIKFIFEEERKAKNTRRRG